MAEKDGISITDLAGSLIEVNVIGTLQTMKHGQSLMIVTAKNGKDEVKFGVIGQKAIDSFLSHGRKDTNGQIFVKVPADRLQVTPDGKIQWINFQY